MYQRLPFLCGSRSANHTKTGTWQEVFRSSSRAKNTDTHNSNSVILCDEPPRYMNDPKAEEKYYDEVQAEKATLQSGQSQYSVFEFAEYNGRKFRVSRNVITDNTVTYAYCKCVFTLESL